MVEGLQLLVYDRERTGLIADVSDMAQQPRQEVTEGPYQFTFTIESEDRGAPDLAILSQYFDDWPMAYLEARFEDVVCWGGHISEMTLDTPWYSKTISTRNLANSIKSEYTDEYSGETRYTSWRTDYESVNLYGRMERIIKFGGKPSAMLEDDGSIKLTDDGDRYTEVHAAEDYELARAAYPSLDDMSFSTTKGDDLASLTVRADGRTVFADTTLVSNGWITDPATGVELRPIPAYPYAEDFEVGSETTVGAEILRLIRLSESKAGWLYPVYIDDNDTMTSAGVEQPMGLWTRVLELARLRNQAGEFYTISVSPDGGVEYRRMDMGPDYLFLEDKGLVRLDGTAPTWTARPGIVQVDGRTISLPRTFMPRQDMVYMERATMAEGYDYAALSMRDVSAADLRRDVEANIRQMDRNKR